MDIDDMPRAVSEAARVLRPGGRMAACVVHPLSYAGSFETREAAAPFRIEGSYLEERHARDTFERGGLTLTFSSTTFTLESYSRAMEVAGLRIDLLREPPPPGAAITDDPAEGDGRGSPCSCSSARSRRSRGLDLRPPPADERCHRRSDERREEEERDGVGSLVRARLRHAQGHERRRDTDLWIEQPPSS